MRARKMGWWAVAPLFGWSVGCVSSQDATSPDARAVSFAEADFAIAGPGPSDVSQAAQHRSDAGRGPLHTREMGA